MRCTRIEMVKLLSIGAWHTNVVLSFHNSNVLLKADIPHYKTDAGLAGPNNVVHDTKPRL